MYIYFLVDIWFGILTGPIVLRFQLNEQCSQTVTNHYATNNKYSDLKHNHVNSYFVAP